MKYSLEDITQLKSKDVKKILLSENVEYYNDRRINNLMLFAIYAKNNMLNVEDVSIINNDNFFKLYMLSDEELRDRYNNYDDSRLDIIRNEVKKLLSEFNSLKVKEADDPLSDNEEISKILQLLAMYYKLEGNKMKSKAFNDAADVIINYDEDITSASQIANLKHIGPSTLEIVDEYLKTGEVKRLNDMSEKYKEKKQVLDILMNIFGVGPEKALKLYDEGYRSLEDLKKANLTRAQKIGLEYYYDLLEKIPREEMDYYYYEFDNIFSPMRIEWDIAGSYRRGEIKSGDIDLIIRKSGDISLQKIVDILKDRDILVADLSLGEKKYMGIAKLDSEYPARRIDIRIFPSDNWPYALLYNTGSKKFNILMRERAKEFGLKLNEHGLFNKDNHFIVALDERNIFSILGVKYLPPEDRTRNISELQLIRKKIWTDKFGVADLS